MKNKNKVILVVLLSAIVVVGFVGIASATIIDHGMSRTNPFSLDIEEDFQLNRTTQFYTTDFRVIFWYEVIVNPEDTFIERWYDPDGNLYDESSDVIPSNVVPSSRWLHASKIPLEANFGEWHIDLYQNGKLKFIEYFTVSPVTPTPGYTASVAGWSEDIRLTSDSAYSRLPAIAADINNNVHITWIDERDGNREIYYTKLDNTGNALVDDTRLTDSASPNYPEIAVDTNNNVHITWNDYRDGNGEIYYTKLDNTGNTLVDDTRVTSDSAYSGSPEIAVDTNNNVHITWYDERDGNYEIYYTKLDNTGNALVDDTRLTSDSALSSGPEIAVDTTNNVHITWNDERDGNREIYYTKLDNTGNTLVDDTRLTSDSAFSKWSAIAVNTTNYVHITWNDERDGNREIYYTKLDNTGNTLVDDTRLTSDSAYSELPKIAVDTNNNVHITWQDGRDGNSAIYYTKLDNTGNTLVDDTRLTSDSAFPGSPAIAVDTNNNVHITWYDKRDGNYEIYYKHSIGLTPTLAYFDTDAGSYPSIMGTHIGTIEPSDNITVSRLYTYPNAGTWTHRVY